MKMEWSKIGGRCKSVFVFVRLCVGVRVRVCKHEQAYVLTPQCKSILNVSSLSRNLLFNSVSEAKQIEFIDNVLSSLPVAIKSNGNDMRIILLFI